MRKIYWSGIRRRSSDQVSKSDAIRSARLDSMLDEALKDPSSYPPTFDEMLTDPDMEMLRGMHVSWR